MVRVRAVGRFGIIVPSMNHQPRHVERALQERVRIVPYDPAWPASFAAEAAHLRQLLPAELIGRIEHFGSTAVPGLAAKPVVDMLLEVRLMASVAQHIAPALKREGYEFFWRGRESGLPGIGYAWFIKRDAAGKRTHHIHCLEPGSREWERLLFRDYLRMNPAVAQAYGELKQRIASEHPDDRVAYAKAKTDFIAGVMRVARKEAGG
ncbi:GrpB family protein [Thauera butanivorans]|uniref:GrpB family protein n=1 Tax=Thauera butanivorans TaxID=86174 RepID=UPI003AB78ABA